MRFKLLPWLVAGVLLASTTARATPTRVLGLGDMGRYVEDDSNVLMYPGLMQKYAHFMYVDFGGPTGLQNSLNDSIAGNLAAGSFVKLTNDLQLGIATSDYSPFEQKSFLSMVSGESAGVNTGAFGDLAALNALRRYDVLVGYTLAKEMGVGLRLSYGSDTKSYTPDLSEKTANPDVSRKNDHQAVREFRATLGFSGQLSRDFGLDSAIDFANYGLTYQINEKDAINNYSGVGLGANVRARLTLTKWWSLIPSIAYRGAFFSLDEGKTVPAFGTQDNAVEPEDLPGNEFRKHSAGIHNLDIGAVAALKAQKVGTFWIGGGFQMNRVTYAGDYTGENLDKTRDVRLTQYALPYLKFGFEMQPLDWMKFRAGAEKFAYSNTNYSYDFDNNIEKGQKGRYVEHTTSGTGALNPGAKDFAAYMGASFFTQNGLTFDFLLDNEILKNGLSGFFTKQFAVRGAVSYKF
jgi:hypothetical protein